MNWKACLDGKLHQNSATLLAERFIATMRTQHPQRISKPESDGRTVTIQLTEADAGRLVTALTAALLAAGRNPGE